MASTTQRSVNQFFEALNTLLDNKRRGLEEKQEQVQQAAKALADFLKDNQEEGQKLLEASIQYFQNRGDVLVAGNTPPEAGQLFSRLAEQDKALYQDFFQRLTSVQQRQLALAKTFSDIGLASLETNQKLVEGAGQYGEALLDIWQKTVGQAFSAKAASERREKVEA